MMIHINFCFLRLNCYYLVIVDTWQKPESQRGGGALTAWFEGDV